MRHLLRLVAVAAVCVALVGCNTVSGLGRDLTTAADWTGAVLAEGFEQPGGP